MKKIFISFFILSIILLSGCEYLNASDGETYNYPCAYQATKLAEESEAIVQKMIDMGCAESITSDALYVRCKELEADNKQIIREWKELICTKH